MKKVKTSSKQGSRLPSDFEDKHHNALVSGLDSGVEVAQRNNNGLGGLRDSDFDDKHFMYRRRMDDSRMDEHNNSIYREAQMEYQMRAAPTALSSQNEGPKEKHGASFMGSDKSEVKEPEEIIQRFDEELTPPMIEEAKRRKKKKQEIVIAKEIRITTDDDAEDARRRIGGKKKKKKKPQYLLDQSEEYAEIIEKPKIYVDRPIPDYRPSNNFEQFTENFYPRNSSNRGAPPLSSNRLNPQRSSRQTAPIFETQFIQQNPLANSNSARNRMIMPPNNRMLPALEYQDKLEKWVSKTTQQGFLYFHLKGTKTYQWNFPRFYDPEVKKTRPYFIDHWIKKYDNRGKKYWQNMHSKHIQHVKPDSETYLIQAAIAGNLAFIELYIKSEGNLIITDQQKRSALHHAVSNGHREITAMICEFSYPLIETQDINGCTPVFLAVRYNETECLKLIISYDCNIYHKMRNGDTCLHVASAYNSLESMILLTNFGGMELFLQRNRYGLRAIDIAEKMRNYECFEVLQKLERGIQYQNAILEREIQGLDSKRGGVVKGPKSARNDYLGAGANYPMMSGRKGASSSRGGVEAPYIQSSRGMMGEDRFMPHQHQMMDDSSLIESSQLDLPPEGDEEAYEQLGGRAGYSRRMQDFQKQSKSMKHERHYQEQVIKDKYSHRDDIKERSKKKHDVEFDDYRKQKTFDKQTKKNLKLIKEEESYSSSPKQRRNRRSSPTHQNKRLPSLTDSEATDKYEQARSHSRKSMHARTDRGSRNIGGRISSEDSSSVPRNDTSQRNQSMFKLSIRDDNSLIKGGPSSKFQDNKKRSKSQTAQDEDQSHNRYLQRHIASRFSKRSNSEESASDEERDGSRNRSSRNKGDRGRKKSKRRDDEYEEKPSLVEIAYDKTTAIVETFRDILVNGYTKIKQYIQTTNTDRQKSRTSKGRSSRRQHTSDDDSSLDRYKTPVGGRSKSRGALSSRTHNQVAPLDTLKELKQEIAMTDRLEDRNKRHVNFNINRVVQMQPETESEDQRIIMRSQTRKQNMQVQVEPIIKSALRNPVHSQQQQLSAKSVGVGSHNINEDSMIVDPPGGFSGSNQEAVQINQQSINSATDLGGGSKKGNQVQEKKKKPGMKVMLRKNYQSSEERGGNPVLNYDRKLQSQHQDQLSPSSRASSYQKEEFILQPVPYLQQEDPRQIQLARQITQSDKGMALSPSKDSIPKVPPAIIRGSANLPTTTSTHKKSVSMMGGSSGSQQRGALLSQEQFDMIMMNSEQEDPKKKKQQSNHSTEAQKVVEKVEAKEEIKSEHESNDIQKFYKDLMQNASISIQLANNALEGMKMKFDPTDVDESNLSNLYNKIMSDNQFDPKKSPISSQGNLKKNKNIFKTEESKQLNKDPEISILTEFNPPSQPILKDRSMRADLSFQSGISDLRRALEEEENLEGVSDCSFMDDYERQKQQLQVQTTNILDRGQFVATQNSIHQSIGNMSQNTSQMHGRNFSAGPRPIMMNVFQKQNNSMHFNGPKYQSDNEEHQTNNNENKIKHSRQGSVQKFQLPLSNQNVGPQVVTLKAPLLVNPLRSSQSQHPISSGGGIGSAHSDNSSANVVVMMSQNSVQTRKQSNDRPESVNNEKHLVGLFKEDSQQSPPQQKQPPPPQIDETQTDLENGFHSRKRSEVNVNKIQNEEENTFKGLSSRTEHMILQEQQLEQSNFGLSIEPSIINQSQEESKSENNTEIMKQTIMKKLVQIMEDPSPNQEPIQQQQIEEVKAFSTASNLGKKTKKNTRYNETEDSLIQFELTRSRIHQAKDNEIEDDQDISLIIIKEGDRKRKGFSGTRPYSLIDNNVQDKLEPVTEQNQQRKSLKLQVQEQIHSIVLSESSMSQQPSPQKVKHTKKTSFSDMSAQVLPLVTLKPAYQVESIEMLSHRIEPDIEQQVSYAFKKYLDRKYNILKKVNQQAAVGNSNRGQSSKVAKEFIIKSRGSSPSGSAVNKMGSRNSSPNSQHNKSKASRNSSPGVGDKNPLLNGSASLDSISRIYNDLETVLEEGDSHSISKNPRQLELLEESKEGGTHARKKSLERKLPPLEIPSTLMNSTPRRKESLLPPLLKVTSEDEAELPRASSRHRDINFYGNTQERTPSHTRRGTSHEDNNKIMIQPPDESATNIPVPGVWRDDKHNRSTATPLFNYNTSSDEEGITSKRFKPVRQSKLLNKLHSSVIGAPLYQQSPSSTMKNREQSMPEGGLKPQRTIKDVSFKSQNISTHTDTSERLKENMKLFSKNRLIQQQQNQKSTTK